MHRGVHVFTQQAFVDQDRVFEVVAHPRCERDEDVLAKSQFTKLCRRTVGDDIAFLNAVTDIDDRLLVKARVLVGALILDQVVDIDVGAKLSAS